MLRTNRWLVLPMLLCLVACTASAQTLINPDSFRSLNADRRGHKVGDTLTVLVVESTSAESAAGTGADSQTSLSANGSTKTTSNQLGLGVRGSTLGSGQTSRRGQIRANVSVRITESLPGGLLRVSGTQELTVNNERQRILIDGLVRPDDISYDNTILSYRLADAAIDIVGHGVVADSQRQNVVYRALKWVRLL